MLWAKSGVAAGPCSSVLSDASSTGHPKTTSSWGQVSHFRIHGPEEAGGLGSLPSSAPRGLCVPEQVRALLRASVSPSVQRMIGFSVPGADFCGFKAFEDQGN